MLDVFPLYFTFGLSVGVVVSFGCWALRSILDAFKKFF